PFLVQHLILADAPEVGGADIAFARADLDAAPARGALRHAANDAVLGEVMHFRPIVGLHANGPWVAGLHDRRPAVAEQADQHPALRSVRIQDQPPVLIFLDHPDREVATLVKPDA